MNLAAVMDAIGNRLDTITDLRVYRYPASKVAPPFAMVLMPDEIGFDLTYGRGSDRLSLPLLVGVGGVSDRAARDQLGAFCDGSGAKSVKAVLESGTYVAFDSLRVVGVTFPTATVAGVDYDAALFDLDIAGAGA